MSQERYVEDILKNFKMMSCNPVSTPMEPGTKKFKYADGNRVDTRKY